MQLDISADNCFWCNLQAPTYREVDLRYRGRGFTLLTILNASLISSLRPAAGRRPGPARRIRHSVPATRRPPVAAGGAPRPRTR